MSEVKFGLFAPDLPPQLGDGENARSPMIVNAIPGALGYYPMPSPAIISADAMAGTPKGGFSTRKPDGSTFVVVGDATKLYALAGAMLTDITRDIGDGGDYATGGDDIWRFIRHGDDLIATNLTDAIQSYDLNNSDPFINHVTSTLKPKARFIAVIGEFVVIAYTDEGGTLFLRRVRWSSINDNGDFDADVTTQADFQDILDSGEITGLLGNKEYGVVFTETALHRMDYVGGEAIFTIDKQEGSEGTEVPLSVLGHDKLALYYSPEGWRRYDGISSYPIGAEQVDEFFKTDFDFGYRHRMRAGIFLSHKLAIWAYPGEGNDNGTPNKMLLYRWDIERWGYVEGVEMEVLFGYMSQGLTLDQLDNISPTLDGLESSLDSTAYSDGRSILGGIDKNGFVVSFNGAALTAYLDTAELSLIPGQLCHVREVRPVFVGNGNTTVSIAVLGRNVPGDDDSYEVSDYLPTEETGEVAMEDVDSYRYHRFRMRIEGGFQHAKGIADLIFTADGGR